MTIRTGQRRNAMACALAVAAGGAVALLLNLGLDAYGRNSPMWLSVTVSLTVNTVVFLWLTRRRPHG